MKVTALLATFLLTISVQAKDLTHSVGLTCTSKAGTLAFTVNAASKKIAFSDVKAFGNAHIQKKKSLDIDTQNNDAYSSELQFSYNWYFTARYELKFDKNLQGLKSGQEVGALFSGDDFDNNNFNELALNCHKK
jgi:hypothetical protein